MNRNHEIVDNRGARDEALADELALLIDGATNYAIYMLDRQGIVTIWNRGAERIKGWTAAEIVGRDFAVFYPAEQASAGKPRDDLARAHLLGRFEEDNRIEQGKELRPLLGRRWRLALVRELDRIGLHRPFTLAEIPYPWREEQAHSMLIGSTGMGKTVAMMD